MGNEDKIGIQFYDQMISENNKCLIDIKIGSEIAMYINITGDISKSSKICGISRCEPIQKQEIVKQCTDECWFDGLREMKWQKVIVCWAKDIFGRTIHRQTALAAHRIIQIIQKFKF
eukprot:315941_1